LDISDFFLWISLSPKSGNPVKNEQKYILMRDMDAHTIVIGSGLVGLATAWRLLQAKPGAKITILEKESGPGQHQSGHNSGVIHSGIYYTPGSAKARNCVEGRLAMIRFCQDHGIAHDLCGKVIVALDQSELPRLEAIYQKGLANGVRCRLLEKEELRELEPHSAGIKAILVEDAGIVDFPGVCRVLEAKIKEAGGKIHFGEKVSGITRTGNRVRVTASSKEFEADLVINCAGLYSDRVAALDADPECRIVPFRGEYYVLKPESRSLCRNLIYPVPDPAFPFLGVHFTRRINGDVECGPNAVLAFAREGYRKTEINLPELAETLLYPAFGQLAAKYWRTGLGEYVRSFSKGAFVRALQRLIPEIRADQLEPAPAGVRAQALAAKGGLVDDFLIRETDSAIHVCNAPSPAATACLTIGEEVARRALARRN
jgi:L-2-hydroxyglutarate oxidase